MSRLIPASSLPLFYFAFAHLCLAGAFAMLVIHPELPGPFFYHPRFVALVHLVTLGWITSSILGAFYIVGPLALRMPLRPGWADRVGFLGYAVGVSGMILHFWNGAFIGIAWSAALVSAAVLHVAIRAWAGLRAAPVPWAVKFHIALAFANVLVASTFGIVIGLNRVFGWFRWSPMSAAFAHAHLAAIGWAIMMVVGLSYRLIPMILPAAMPTGSAMARSAILLEVGVLGLAVALLFESPWTTPAAVVIIAGLVAFVQQIRAIVRQRRPPPAALPRPDWATWQTHLAFVWFVVAAALGLVLTLPLAPAASAAIGWTYGVAGLVGFLSQVVVGIQGRLLPLHGWYRLFEARGFTPPDRSAHTLARPALAKAILIAWTAGVPLLAAGLATQASAAIIAGAGLLFGGVVLNAAQTMIVATGGSHN